MNTLREDRELVVDLPLEERRTMAGVMEVLARSGVTVQSLLQSGTGEQALLVTDNTDQAVRALGAAGYRWRIDPVVLVGVATGDRWAGLRAGQALHKAGVSILHSYVSRSPTGKLQAIFQTTDNRYALHILATEQTFNWRRDCHA